MKIIASFKIHHKMELLQAIKFTKLVTVNLILSLEIKHLIKDLRKYLINSIQLELHYI